MEVLVPERDLVSQCLYALLGTSCDVFTFHSVPTSFTAPELVPLPYGSRWKVRHVGCVAVYSNLHAVLEVVTIVQRVRSVIYSCFGAKSGKEVAPVAQSFGEWASTCLAAFTDAVLRKLRDANAGCGLVSLLSLQDWLSHHAQSLRLLEGLCESCREIVNVEVCGAAVSARILDVLVETHKQLEFRSGLVPSDACELVWTGLHATLDTFLSFVDGWMTDGEVTGTPPTLRQSAPLCLQHLWGSIVGAGECVALLRESAVARGVVAKWCKPIVAPFTVHSIRSVNDIFNGLNREDFVPFRQTEEKLLTASAEPRYMELERRLSNLVKTRYAAASTRLMYHFIEELGLLTHLDCIRAVFCFASGYRMDDFAEAVFEKLYRGDLHLLQDGGGLTAFLRACLDSGTSALTTGTIAVPTPSHRSRMSFGSPSVSRIGPPVHTTTAMEVPSDMVELFTVVVDDSSTAQTFLQSSFGIKMSLQPPLTRIFSERVVEKYTDITRLLMQVKYAKFVLERVHRETRQVEPKLLAAIPCVEGRRLSYIPRHVHKLRVCLHMVMHFVNSLHLHFMNKVAFSDWNTLYSNLTTAGDMQQVIALHDEFLEEIRRHMLIGDPFKFARREITGLLVRSAEFAALFRDYHHQAAATIRAFAEAFPASGVTKRHRDVITDLCVGFGLSSVVEPSASRHTGAQLCSTETEALRDKLEAALAHSEGFKKVLSVCVGVMRHKLASSGTNLSHFEDVIVALNFNEFYQNETTP